MKTFLTFLALLAAVFVPGPAPEKTPAPDPAPARAGRVEAVVNREYLPLVLEMIAGSRERIEFLQLEFHYDPEVKQLQDALRAALARGVKVRGLLEDNISFNRTSARYLNQFGIETKLDTPEKMLHNKLFIFDRNRVLLGSTNLSGNSLRNNNETNLRVDDPRIGAFFGRYFDQLWGDSNREPQEVAPVELPEIKTVVNRQHFPELISLLDGGRRRIWVVMYGMSYNERYPGSHPNRLIEALGQAARRGVDVRVILDRSDYNEGINRVNDETSERLGKTGVKVRFDREDVTTHAKLVIVDEKAMVGSANWGYQAMDVRNESSLLVQDKAVVEDLTRYFLEMWDEGTFTGTPAPTPFPTPGT